MWLYCKSWMTLVLYVASVRDLGSVAGNVAVKIPFVVNLKDDVAQTAWSLFILPFERADTETIAQK